MNSKLMPTALKIGGIAGVVMAILKLIPCIGCLNCILVFFPGILLVHFALNDGQTVEMGEAAINGAIAGALAALVSSVISLPIMIVTGGLSSMASMASHQGMDPAMMAMLTGPMLLIAGIVISIIAIIISAMINAGTGALYLMFKNK